MFEWGIIDEKKRELDALRPLPQNTLKSLKAKLDLEWTYNSNAIEGNTLTLKETKVVLEGITVGGKSLKEHLEVTNHSTAIEQLNKLIQKKEDISEKTIIKNIHSFILNKIDSINAGVYRSENVFIVGAEHKPPNYTHVPDEMKNLIECCNKKWKILHPAELSALLHIDFVKIHPFVVGNGRTARLLQNFELMKTGFPPIIIKKEQRLNYYNVLDKAHTKNQPEDFIKLTADCLKDSLNIYINAVKGNNT